MSCRVLSIGIKDVIELIVDQSIDYIELNPGDPRLSFSFATSQYGNVEIACLIFKSGVVLKICLFKANEYEAWETNTHSNEFEIKDTIYCQK